jgi:hypothetical protein
MPGDIAELAGLAGFSLVAMLTTSAVVIALIPESGRGGAYRLILAAMVAAAAVAIRHNADVAGHLLHLPHAQAAVRDLPGQRVIAGLR